mmetsp:Transcript_69579/g.126923  ORF Transcript_69579/g.126923 Transcript_69579/m.126923 type:complete len:123 (+) Transcript_69579:433-801(+)
MLQLLDFRVNAWTAAATAMAALSSNALLAAAVAITSKPLSRAPVASGSAPAWALLLYSLASAELAPIGNALVSLVIPVPCQIVRLCRADMQSSDEVSGNGMSSDASTVVSGDVGEEKQDHAW